MMIDISADAFKKVFDNKAFFLPRRWDGKNFLSTISDGLFRKYLHEIECELEPCAFLQVQMVCSHLTDAIKMYFDGQPALALGAFDHVMDFLMGQPLKTYRKTTSDGFFRTAAPRLTYSGLEMFSKTPFIIGRTFFIRLIT